MCCLQSFCDIEFPVLCGYGSDSDDVCVKLICVCVCVRVRLRYVCKVEMWVCRVEMCVKLRCVCRVVCT